MDDEEDAVVPNNCVGQILDLVRSEKEKDTLTLRVVGKHSLFVRNRHGLWVFPSNRVEKILVHMSASVSQVSNYHGRESIYTNVSRQDVSIGFVVQDWVEILKVKKQFTMCQ